MINIVMKIPPGESRIDENVSLVHIFACWWLPKVMIIKIHIGAKSLFKQMVHINDKVP